MKNGYRKIDPKTKMVFVDSEVEVVIIIVIHVNDLFVPLLRQQVTSEVVLN